MFKVYCNQKKITHRKTCSVPSSLTQSFQLPSPPIPPPSPFCKTATEITVSDEWVQVSATTGGPNDKGSSEIKNVTPTSLKKKAVAKTNVNKNTGKTQKELEAGWNRSKTPAKTKEEVVNKIYQKKQIN